MAIELPKAAGRCVAVAFGLLAIGAVCEAQQGPSLPQTAPAPQTAADPAGADTNLRERVERLERQNQELLKRITDGVVPVSNNQNSEKAAADAAQTPSAAGAAPGGQDKAATTQGDGQAAKQADDWYRIGSLMDVKASFNEYGNLWFKTPNSDFTMHIGAWMQYDNVFWQQSRQLLTPAGVRSGPAQGVASGAPQGGIGDLEDGTFFRRIRPFAEGTLWDTFEYRLILALENEQFETSGLDEFWVSATNLPLIGQIRIGHIKDPLGLEGDNTSSSRTMTFMERSSYSEAIELNQNFVTGIWFGNNFFDQHMTYAFAAFRPDQAAATGGFFGDGQWGMQGRLTFLPVYDNDGRQWLHLGVSAGWRNGQSVPATSPARLFQLRARPELRDDDPGGSAGDPQVLPGANSTRMVDTGPIAARDEYLMGLEALYVRGPFSLQAEYGWNWIDGAYGIAPTGLKLNPALTSPQQYVFPGGYVQVAYTLTGENRTYDRRYGILTRQYFANGPYSNAWLVRDENGNLCCGIGAWEIAARYSYVNLNDGPGKNRIQGGTLDGLGVALNWYLNSNVTWMFDWVYNDREDLPKGSATGYTSGFGTRIQLSF